MLRSLVNNTYIYKSTIDCESKANASRLRCEAVLGGFFDWDSSSTWLPGANASTLGMPPENGQIVNYTYGIDTLTLDMVSPMSNSSLLNFSFGFPSNDLDQATNFGLGKDSSVLNDLYAAGSMSFRISHGAFRAVFDVSIR